MRVPPRPPTPDELAMPEFEDRLWDELARLHARRAPARAGSGRRGRHGRHGPRQAGRRGRALAVAVGTVAAGAAAVVAVAVLPGRGSGPEPAAVEASATERVLAAMDEAGDAVVHETRRDPSGRVVSERWYDEVTAAGRYRRMQPDGSPLFDSGRPEPPRIDEEPDPDLVRPESGVDVCDPNTGLAMGTDGSLVPCERGPVQPQPTRPTRVVDHCNRVHAEVEAPVVVHPGWGYIRMFAEAGHLVPAGTEEVDGRPLLRLHNEDSSVVMLVDPETYLPASVTTTGPGMPGEGGETTTYERLARTEENLALLSPPVPDGYTWTTEPPAVVTMNACPGAPSPGDAAGG